MSEQQFCRGPNCRKPIEWRKTAYGKWTCLNPDGSPHWSTCPDIDLFKKAKTESPKTTPKRTHHSRNPDTIPPWEIQ